MKTSKDISSSSSSDNDNEAGGNTRLFGLVLGPAKRQRKAKPNARKSGPSNLQRKAVVMDQKLPLHSWPEDEQPAAGVTSSSSSASALQSELQLQSSILQMSAADGDDCDFDPDWTADLGEHDCVPHQKALTEIERAHAEDNLHHEIEQALADQEHVFEGDEEGNGPSSSHQTPRAQGIERTVARPPLALGVIGCSQSPTRGKGSVCFFCDQTITKGTWRFEYRFSTKIPRWIHIGCVASIPSKGEARQNSIGFLKNVLAAQGRLFDDLVTQEIQQALLTLEMLLETRH